MLEDEAPGCRLWLGWRYGAASLGVEPDSVAAPASTHFQPSCLSSNHPCAPAVTPAEEVFKILGDAVPSSSNFFINFVMYRWGEDLGGLTGASGAVRGRAAAAERL